MSDWEKHVVPDWVVDDYNSRVPKEDRLPISETLDEDDFEDIDGVSNDRYIKSVLEHKREESQGLQCIDDFFRTVVYVVAILFLIFCIIMSV